MNDFVSVLDAAKWPLFITYFCGLRILRGIFVQNTWRLDEIRYPYKRLYSQCATTANLGSENIQRAWSIFRTFNVEKKLVPSDHTRAFQLHTMN